MASANAKHTEKASAPYRMLDAWRGLASLWVMGYHAVEVMIKQHGLSSSSWLVKLLGNGVLGVPMFFVISGYCISTAALAALQRGHSAARFAKARLRRIFPTYWAALALTALLSIAAEMLVQSGRLHSSDLASRNVASRSLAWYAANLTLANPLLHGKDYLVMQAWSLSYEAAFYLMIGLMLMAAAWRNSRETLLWCAHVITLAAIALLLYRPRLLHFPLDLWPEFGLGVLLYHSTHRRSNPALAAIWVLAGIGLTLLYTLYHSRLIGWNTDASVTFQYPFAFLFALLLLLLYPQDERIVRWRIARMLGSIGIFSYTLYLTHTFSIGLVNHAIKFLHLSRSYNAAAFLAMTAGAVIFARVFYEAAEKPFLSQAGRARAKELGTAVPAAPPAQEQAR